MACKNRSDVVQVLERAEQLIFEECQRGSFNANAHDYEREMIKTIVRLMRVTRKVLCPKQQEHLAIDKYLPMERSSI